MANNENNCNKPKYLQREILPAAVTVRLLQNNVLSLGQHLVSAVSKITKASPENTLRHFRF